MKIKIENLHKACGYLLGTLIFNLFIVLMLAVISGAFCFEGWILMLLWNWLAVELLGASVLGYWVCVGIVFAP